MSNAERLPLLWLERDVGEDVDVTLIQSANNVDASIRVHMGSARPAGYEAATKCWRALGTSEFAPKQKSLATH